MKYYLVGTPEPVLTNGFLFPEKKFSKEEIKSNLNAIENIRIFTSLADAREYARAQRIRIPAKFAVDDSPSKKKFSPVVQVKLINNTTNYELNSHNLQSETITVKEYTNILSNGGESEHICLIQFILASKNFDIDDFNIEAVEFPDTHFPITKFNQTSLSFFRSLNPESKNSGITINSPELIDNTLGESIQRSFNSSLSFLSGLKATFDILVGKHFEWSDNQKNAKGLLDFLILPLIARRLIADTYLIERKNSTLTNVLAWSIAIPIEIMRCSIGSILTFLLIPVIALIHLIKAYLPEEQMEENTIEHFL